MIDRKRALRLCLDPEFSEEIVPVFLHYLDFEWDLIIFPDVVRKEYLEIIPSVRSGDLFLQKYEIFLFVAIIFTNFKIIVSKR